MSVIKCPGCGIELLDGDGACPVCGTLITSQRSFSRIRIDLNKAGGLGKPQPVKIMSRGTLLWQGEAGQVAEFDIAGPTLITVDYGLTGMHYEGAVTVTIDPAQGTHYVVNAARGFFATNLSIFTVG